MRPTFHLLGGEGWRTAALDGLVEDGAGGLSLAADPSGRLSLRAPSGTLGSQVLPRGVAVGPCGRVFLLVGSRVRRFDPAEGRFVELPAVGGPGSSPRRLRDPRGLAIGDARMVIADTGNRRVQVFALDHLSLLNVVEQGEWRPVDVAVHRRTVLVLDESGRIFRLDPGGTLEIARGRSDAPPASRLVVDHEGRMHVLRGDRIEVFGATGGTPTETIDDVAELHGRFDDPVVVLDSRGRFCLGPSASAAPRRLHPLAGCEDGRVFTLDGESVELPRGEPELGPIFRRSGLWESTALDSGIHDCRWHRIELRFASLPPATSVRVSTATTSELVEPGSIAAEQWLSWSFAAPAQGARERSSSSHEDECLVRSPRGRWLYLRIELGGDGFGTPALEQLRVHYPRNSYLEELPAVFREAEDEGDELARFLSVFQTEWDSLEERAHRSGDLFDPETSPGGPWLDYLASWLALPLEGDWSDAQKRRAIRSAIEHNGRRGTLAALRDHVRVALGGLLDRDPGDTYPILVEGFRRRQAYQVLGQRLGHAPGVGLWSREFLGRLQLEMHDREGEVRLVDVGDPELDLFEFHANRLTVYVPAAWVRTDEDEQKLRRAISAESPAHVCYDLELVEPAMRLGIQSTVGVDTILGDVPEVPLGDGQLGQDTVLGGAAAERGTQVGGEQHLGAGTRLL